MLSCVHVFNYVVPCQDKVPPRPDARLPEALRVCEEQTNLLELAAVAVDQL